MAFQYVRCMSIAKSWMTALCSAERVRSHSASVLAFAAKRPPLRGSHAGKQPIVSGCLQHGVGVRDRRARDREQLEPKPTRRRTATGQSSLESTPDASSGIRLWSGSIRNQSTATPSRSSPTRNQSTATTGRSSSTRARASATQDNA